MSSVLKFTVLGVKAVLDRLEAERKNTLTSMQKAHTKVAAQAVTKLKRGLAREHGRWPRDKDYRNSPKGSLPYKHSGRLQASIGFKVITRGNKVTSEVGSGAMGIDVDYAKYLEGRDGNGIRPFLAYIDKTYNAEKVIAAFKKIYKPLSGRKK